MEVQKGHAQCPPGSLSLKKVRREVDFTDAPQSFFLKNKGEDFKMKLGIEGDSPDSISQYCLINTDIS